MTMSDDGDKSCPLCAEEMDLTDQQLKPCKCGYEICVWCWNHIMEMAEKVGTVGRCPACRCSYDKERIVGMATNCERLLAGMNADRRPKIQKGKPKVSAETRKQLSSIRVIQKNLVYIIGLPLNLCDENLLEGMKYFGRYGNVLKVSISRPSSSINQHAYSNSSFGVYINYAREEEAVRCIQAVNNFILDGKPLRACFGTTKYCHAWLRNMNCSNPDCLYMHEIASQEDSFSKDEIISAYSRVPKIATRSFQRRAGNSLPPPVDEFSINGNTANKNIARNILDNTTAQAKVLNGSIGKHTVLPATSSWGSSSSLKQNSESNSTLTCSSANHVIKQEPSAWHDDLHPVEVEEKHALLINGTSNLSKCQPRKDCLLSDDSSTTPDLSDVSFRANGWDHRDSSWDDTTAYVPSSFHENSYDVQTIGDLLLPLRKVSVDDSNQLAAGVDLPSDFTSVETDQASFNLSSSSSSSSVLEENSSDRFKDIGNNMNAENGMAIESLANLCVAPGVGELTCSCTNVNQDIENAFSNLSFAEVSENNVPQRTLLPCQSLNSVLKNPSSSAQELFRKCVEKSVLLPSHTVQIISEGQHSIKLSGCYLESEQIYHSSGERIEDLSLLTSDVRQRLPEASNQRLNLCTESNGQHDCTINSHAIMPHSSHCVESLCNDEFKGLHSLVQNIDTSAGEQYDNKRSNIYKPADTLDSPHISSNESLVHLDRVNNIDSSNKCSSMHIKENSIISDILSMDFDPWEDSSSIENNLYKLLGAKSLKTHNSSNQSRFSFARQENQESFNASSVSSINQAGKDLSVKASYEDAFQNDFRVNETFSNAPLKNSTSVSSDKPAGISRAKLSAPPGFSLPSRAPPPGFSVQDLHDQNLKIAPDAHRLMYPTESSGDVEFIDPAILAVGKGLVPVGGDGNGTFYYGSVFPAQFNSSECDPRHHLLLQKRGSSFQSMDFPNYGRDNNIPVNDSYISSCLLAQNKSSLSTLAQMSHQSSRIVPISSNHWDGLSNSVQTNTSMGANDFLRNQRLGLNSYYIGNAEGRLHFPSSSDIYGRTFGI